MKKSARQVRIETQKKKQQRQKILLYSGLGVIAVAVIVVVVLLVTSSPASTGLMGDEVIVPSRDHVAVGTVPGPFNSSPPAGGAHYPTNFTAHFYQESEVASLPVHPEGYLVHSLEHGYVIFWYNCQIANTDCAALKKAIQTVMDQTGNTKLIAFPWSDMNTPLAMTSWGRILRLPTADTAQMKQFVERNRYQAPEPDAS